MLPPIHTPDCLVDYSETDGALLVMSLRARADEDTDTAADELTKLSLYLAQIAEEEEAKVRLLECH